MGFAEDLALRMVPAYAAVAVGFSIGRLSRRDWLRWISNLLMYVLIPIVVFKNTASLGLDQAVSGIAISIAFSITMVAIAIIVVPRIQSDVPQRLAYCSFGYTNIGWFGIPTGLALFGSAGLPILVMAYVGGLLFGNTIGFYLVARDRFSVEDSIKKVTKLPAIHAFAAGLLVRHFSIQQNPIAYFETPFWIATILMSASGMMVVGLGASRVTFSWPIIRGALTLVIFRHVSAICAISLVIWIFTATGDMIKSESLGVVFLIGLLPVAGNIVLFSSQIGSGIAISSLIISISTIISTIIIILFGMILGTT